MSLALVSDETHLDRTPPNDLAAEQAVLGACLNFGRVPEVTEGLVGEDFYRPAHEQVWAAIVALSSTGKPCDIHAVRAALTERGEIGKVGGPLYLVELIEAAPTGGAGLSNLVAIVADRSSRRREITAATRIMQAAYQSSRDADQRLADADASLAALPRLQAGSASRSWEEIEPTIIDRIQRGMPDGLSTPWPDLNSRIIGLIGGQMIVVAARPGEGKTLVGQALAVRMATFHQRKVLYASLEMTEEDLGIRIVAEAASVDAKQLKRGNLTDDQWGDVAKGRTRRARMPLHINDSSTQTMAQIRSEARRLQRAGDLGLVVIDHIGRVRPRDPRMDKRLQMNEISWGCKQLAKELNVPVVALSQLNRQSLSRTDKAPNLGDLKETGNIEEDADVVCLMSLDKETNDLTLNVAKNRNGELGLVNLQMWGHISRVLQSDQAFTSRGVQ